MIASVQSKLDLPDFWSTNTFVMIMHQSFVTPAPPPPTYGDSGANVRGSDLLSSPAVPGKCRACDIVNIPHGIYSYKEQGYDSQQVPAVQGF